MFLLKGVVDGLWLTSTSAPHEKNKRMEISLRDILAKRPNPGLREANIRHTVADAITKLTGVTVTPSQIKHEDGRLILNVPPVLKSALLLRIEELKSALKENGIELIELR